MKKILIFLSIIVITLIKSQTVSDYKYVLIPNEFNDFKGDRSFGLNIILKNSLNGKKYVVLSETKSQWPADVLKNPCKVLNAEILEDKSMFRNKVILQFKDCNNQVILAEKGGSTIKDFQDGYRDALRQSLMKIAISNPSAEIEKLAESKPQIQPKETNMPVEVISSLAPTAQKYSNGKLTLQKIQIDDSQFILADGNSSVPFATFKSTAKKDVYRVRLASGDSTIGYYENGNIVIEMPKANGEFANEIFTAN